MLRKVFDSLFAHLPGVLRGTSSLCLSVPRPGIEPRIRRPKRRVISVSPSGRVCHSTTKRAETRAYVLICSCEASAGRKLVRAYGTVLRFGNAVSYSQRSLDSLKWIAASRVRIVSRRGMRSRPHYRHRTGRIGTSPPMRHRSKSRPYFPILFMKMTMAPSA